jgi:LacI family transcriptional regulator
LKNPKVTLADVAARAGMSQATASRALRGLNVHKKHKGKAEAAATELGYVLNESARSLRSVRTMTVGMVFHNLTSMIGMELLKSFSAGLDEIGYSLFISTAQGQDDQFDKLVHRLLQRRVDALVCVHGKGTGAALGGYASGNVPVMALVTKSGGYGHLPMVHPTVDGAVKACAKRLQELGHSNVVVLARGKSAMPTSSFLAVAKAAKLKLIREHIDDATFDARALLKAYMERRTRPTAIVAFQADATKLLEAASTLKIKVPRDLSIVAIRDYSPFAPAVPTVFSTIHLDPRIMGELASGLMKSWLVEGRALTKDRPVEIGSWIERGTTGPAPHNQ